MGLAKDARCYQLLNILDHARPEVVGPKDAYRIHYATMASVLVDGDHNLMTVLLIWDPLCAFFVMEIQGVVAKEIRLG